MTDREDEALETIRRGLFYTESEASFQNPLRRADLIFEYNNIRPGDADRRRALLEAILGSVGERTVLLSHSTRVSAATCTSATTSSAT
ncbi:maltose acetyltransferase domain-containing protein [Micromonospora sp. M12]